MDGAYLYFKDNSPMLETEYPFTSAHKDKDAPAEDCKYDASRATNIKV